MRVTLKIISLVLAAGFLATSAFAAADSRLRPSSVKTSGQRMFDLREDVVAIGEKDGGSRQVITLSSLQKVVQAKKINSGFIALDWNIKKIKKTEDLERIIKSLDTIEYSFKDLGAQYAYGLTSRVRPKAGVFTKELSLEEIVDNARKLMVDRGMKDILVELLSYDLDAAALRIKELKTKNPGKKIFFIFENLRFYEGERSKDEKVRAAFEQRLIDLTNQDAEELFYINEAFDKSHRGKEASMELVQMIPLENRAVGKALEKDLNAVLNFLSILKSDGKLVLYVGGSKFDKMPNIAEIAKVFGNRLTVVLGGAQVNPWRSLKKKSIGLSLMPSGEELEGTQKALEDIERFGAKLVAAEDFTVAEMRDGVFTVVGEDMVEISGKQMQVDIGLRSIQQLKDIIGELGPGDGFIMNGGAGKFDEKDPVMSKGSFALVDAALEAKKIGVANLGAGGDMFELLKKYELEVNPDILKLIDFSTGGGVNWAIIGQGAEKLPAIDAVLVPAGRAGALADGGMAMTNQVKVLDNHVGLFEGADTGTSNAMHARAQGADGVIINHSEDRETLELLFQAKANEILKRYTEALNSNLGVESVQAAIKKDFVSYLKRETGIIAPEEKDKDKKKPFVDAGITISYEELNAKVDSWLSKLYEATPENEEAAVERFYRSVTNKVMNIKLKEQIFHSSVYNKPEVILCSGETEKQYLAKRTREVLKEDHEEMLEGISPADIAKINFIRAYEPRWAIGTGKTPTNQEITDTHLFIIEVDKKLTKQEVPVLYGGSMNEKNEEAILNLPGVAGGLIGGKALAPADIGQMIGIAVRVGQEMGGKIFYMGMNWKASEPKPAAGFVKLFQGTDLSKIRISIGTPTVKLVKDEIQKPVDSWKQKLISLAGRVKLEFASLRGFVAADAQQNELKGGKAWSEMTAEMIKPKMRAVLDGIKDSRGKQTIRVVMEVPGLGIEVYGEAPAGKSTGDAEAKTVDLETQEGKDRVMNEIMPFISKKLEEGKYDFRDYKDVVRFHEMLIKEAGEDYSKLGGNVTTAVSFAIYELYAKLNNMNLDKAIAKAEPEAVGTGVINYISNMLNGGLHSIVEELGEKLGIDRMSIQEIMFVPLARSYVKRLLMLDQADERLGKRLTTAYGKENIARGDEAGFKIKFTGKADDKAAIRHVIEQAVEAGLKPGKDFLISLDVAASEFYNKDTKMYTFLGEEKTSQAMIDFYVEMVEEYKKEYGVNVFYSIEDGLAQDDWDGWVKLTQAMDKYDILTVGDDLFCTNIERLRKGIEMGAASAILIKVNQNGTVWGTLKTIALARQAAGMGARKKDIKVFLSHRSGETKYTGISFLASGVKAEALKTGASQPETAYPDQNTWVRRAKYLVMNLLGQGHVFNKKDKAMLVSTDYIAKAGIKGISELEKFSNTQLIVYGKNARKAVQLLGIEGLDTKQIMTARNQDNAIKAAKLELGIQVEDIVVVRTPAEQEAKYGFAGNMEVLKQVAAEGASPALELGKAVKMLYKNREVNLAFEKVIEAVDAKVVEKLTNDQKIALLESNRGTFDFTDTYMELKLTDKVAKSVEGVEREVRTVLSQI